LRLGGACLYWLAWRRCQLKSKAIGLIRCAAEGQKRLFEFALRMQVKGFRPRTHDGFTTGLLALRANRPCVPACATRFLGEFLLAVVPKETKRTPAQRPRRPAAGARSRSGWNGWSCLNSLRSDRHAHKDSVPPYAPPASVKGKDNPLGPSLRSARLNGQESSSGIFSLRRDPAERDFKYAGSFTLLAFQAGPSEAKARPLAFRALDTRRAAQARTGAFWTCLSERSEFKHGQPFWPEPRSVRPKAGEVVGTRSFGFFCIVWQKKLALQAKRGRNAFDFLVATRPRPASEAWAKRL